METTSLKEFDNVIRLLNEYSEEVKRLYKERLEKDGKRATGALIDNIETEVRYNNLSFKVVMSLADYWKYIEDGTRAHWPPRDAILKWIKAKPIIPTPDSRGKLPTDNQLAFLISRAMAGLSPNQEKLHNPEGGIVAGKQLAKTVEELNARYLPLLQEALQADFDSYAIYIFKDTVSKLELFT